MKTLSKVMLAGATLTAAGAASAQISNTQDLILFVTDTATNAAFVQDLGTLTSTVNPTGCTSTNGSCSSLSSTPVVGSITNPTVGPGVITAGVDTQLASFLSTNGATTSPGNFVYGILGYFGNAGPGFNQSVAVSTLDESATGMLADYNGSGQSPPFAGQTATLFYGEPSTSQAQGSYQEINSWFLSVKGGFNSTPYGSHGGVGGQAAAALGAASDFALGTTSYLWALASNGSGNDANFYGSNTGITVNSDGTITGLGSAAVPLPAAVWLLGGGLLGLAGISRRRLA
jgi:hypothetical protein